ncbi:MAG: thiamine-phosphate kinase [Rikenellaceae bacterium]|nr:thiamine-phosphate kinase [Rikenellaceae bacterium]
MLKNTTEISALGQFGLIEKLTADFAPANASTVRGPGDDAAVIACGDNGAGEYKLLSTDLLLEGVHFDLTYFPLKHLGYKAVVAGVSDIYAMNGRPEQLTLALGVSTRMKVEMLEEFYAGVRRACSDYGVDLAGGDLSTSLTGFTIAVSVLGSVAQEKITYRGGAKENDLICITGDLGAAYMGLRLLEREKRVLEGHNDPKPEFEGYEYLLRRQLAPAARPDVIVGLAAAGVVPTSMIDLTDGLASDLLQICKASGAGACVYLERIPISSEVNRLCEQMHSDPVVAALNGGEDYELLFTVPLALQEKITDIGGIDVIGHITAPDTGVKLVTPDGGEISMTAPGWTALV